VEPLNAKLIKWLVKEQKRVNTSCPLYPVEYKFSVCLTDNTIMIEWPKDMVDLCEAYFDLFKNCESKRSLWERYEQAHWKKQFIRPNRMTPAIVGDMSNDENAELFEPIGGAVPFDAKTGRWYYHPAYLAMLELAVPQARFQIYIPDDKQNMPKDVRLLCAFDEGEHVAVVLDQPVREYR
jgi:hypothetical protein